MTFLAAALLFVALTAPSALAGPKPEIPQPPAPDIGVLREVTVQVALGLMMENPGILLKSPTGGTSSSSSEPAPTLTFDKLAGALTGRLVKLYEGLVIDVPDFGTLMGLNFGIVMYANSDFAPHSPAPTQLEGSAPPLPPASLLSDLCDVPPGTTLPEKCALGGSLNIGLTYNDIRGPLQLPLKVEQALKEGFHIILFWCPAAQGVVEQGMRDRFKEVERNCILKTRLAKLLKSSDASTIQAAIDSLNAEVAMCLDQEMQAGDYHSMGIFVGEKQRTTQYFGGGHALIKISRISDWSFKALPGFEAHLRIVYWPAAPKQLQ